LLRFPHVPDSRTTAVSRPLVGAVGFATCFFGFLASAALSLYLAANGHPLAHDFRTVLGYKSAILGDGLILPIANMAVATFLITRRRFVNRAFVLVALLFGIAITGCVHVFQATYELVNWSMPAPWHWNMIGLWHAVYMESVISWLALFILVVAKTVRQTDEIPREARLVLLCVLLFLSLLFLDYRSMDFGWLPSAT
jgi:hypothetical protein